MYEVVRRDQFVNPAEYEVCLNRFEEQLPEFTYESGCEEQFVVDIPRINGEPDWEHESDAEDIFGDFMWKEINV